MLDALHLAVAESAETSTLMADKRLAKAELLKPAGTMIRLMIF
jgi:predicted nucleic acid-binding protein